MNTMKNWRHLITGITTLAVISLGNYALAEETADPGKDCKGKHSFHQHMKGDRPFEHMGRMLKLTDEQKQTLAARKDEQRTQYREQRQQIRQTQRALHEAVANNANEAEVTALAEKLGDLNAQQVIAQARDKQFLLSILTPEQKEKMEQMKSKRKKHWREKATDTRA